MKALFYLIMTQLKNRILSLKKKPGMMILYICITVIIVLSVVMLMIFGDQMSQRNMADERIIFLIIAGFGLLFLYTFTITGLSTGSSLFTMPDVGLLFVSPISSKKILMYGLLSTLGKSLLGSVFIFYQVVNLKANFGYGAKEVLALFVVFALMLLFCQLLSIGIYIFTNGNSLRKNVVKSFLYVLLLGFALSVYLVEKTGDIGMWEALLKVIASDWFGYVPVAGWTIMFFVGVAQGALAPVLISLALFIGFGILVVMLLTAGKADYYEDVLISTEYTYTVQKAAKEGGNMPRAERLKIKVKDGEPGIGKGSGAMVIFHKQLLEMKRKSRFVFVDNFTIFAIVLLGVVGYNMKLREAPAETYYGVLGIMIYLQYFLVAFGRFKMELLKPYIFLIPESSLKKVLAASLTSLVKPCVDGVLFFTILTITGNINPLHSIFLALAYAASGAVFVGMVVLYQRVLGGQPNKLVQTFIGMGLLATIMAPSVGASVIAGFLLPESLKFMSILPYAVFCILFAVLLFVLNGNLLDKTEYTGKL